MARYTRTPVSTLQGINNELAKVELAMEDTLDRKGVTPNFMDANLDMNSRRILNLPLPLTDQEPLRRGDVPTGLSVSAQYVDDRFLPTPTFLKAQGLSGNYGFFDKGFTYNESGDVGIDSDGKIYVYAGGDALPVAVAAGTDPVGSGDYKALELNVAPFKTIADMKSSSFLTALPEGTRVEWQGYYEQSDGGSNWGVLKFGAHTDDGGSIFSIDANTYVEANLKGKKLNAKKFGLKGNYTDDDKPRLVALWNFAPWGTTIFYPAGQYKIDGGHTHPLKQLYHEGVGESPGYVPSTSTENRGGTSFYFPTFTPINKGGIYMPPPNGAEFCRFSSFSNMSFLGNGTSDDTGNVTCLKINNLGTNLYNVNFRYGAVGVECNYSVGSQWKNVTLGASTYAAVFAYDVATPFGTEKNSVATQNNFDSVVCHTSRTKTNAIGWYVDATCSYGGNKHSVWDMESCYTGAKFEGRISSKDHDGLSVFGAAAWQSSGNTFISAWFERNVGKNLVLSYDPGQQAPALSFDGIYEDAPKITSAGDANSLLKRPNSIVPLFLGSGDKPQGNIGQLGNPFTAGQYLMHGPEINTPHKRSLVDSRIPHQAANRPTFNTNSSFEFDAFVPNMPLLASTINVANVTLGNPIQSAAVDIVQVGTGSNNTKHVTFGKYLVENNNDTINSVIIQEVSSGATVPLHFQAARTGINTFGLFVWKDATLTAVTNVTISFKVVIGGNSGGGNQANLSILI